LKIHAASVTLLLLAACGPTGAGPGLSRVRLHLTDAPGPGIASAQVWVSRAYLVPGTDGEQVVLSSEPNEYDLLTLQNGVTALVGEATIPAGDYSQLRLVVDSARLTLADDAKFADGAATRTLKVPSGSQSGIKVSFPGKLSITEDATDLVVDFDVAENFVFQGPSAGPFSVLFTPHLKGSTRTPAAP